MGSAFGLETVRRCQGACGRELAGLEFLPTRRPGVVYLWCSACRHQAYRTEVAAVEVMECPGCRKSRPAGAFIAWAREAGGGGTPSAAELCYWCRPRAMRGDPGRPGETRSAAREAREERILGVLGQQARTAAELGAALGMAESSARRYLVEMAKSGKVESASVPQRRGRPWVLYGLRGTTAAEMERRGAAARAEKTGGARPSVADLLAVLPCTGAEAAARFGVAYRVVAEVAFEFTDGEGRRRGERIDLLGPSGVLRVVPVGPPAARPTGPARQAGGEGAGLV